jgi:hypothetical protein
MYYVLKLTRHEAPIFLPSNIDEKLHDLAIKALEEEKIAKQEESSSDEDDDDGKGNQTSPKSNVISRLSRFITNKSAVAPVSPE